MDEWDGCAHSRRRSAVVLIDDVHVNQANEIKVDYKDPAFPVGSELGCGAITSTAMGDCSTLAPVNWPRLIGTIAAAGRPGSWPGRQ